MLLVERELEFNFSNTIQAFKFDEKEPTSPHYHGASHCMKAVDFIVEREHDWLFVEVKDFNGTNQTQPSDLNSSEKRKRLLESLKGKYKDTFLYRWAEGKIDDKPIHYVCLVEWNDEALTSLLMKELKQQLPIGLISDRWQNELLKSVIVVNMAKWNVHFAESPVTRTSST
jgi:hypothetical protein